MDNNFSVTKNYSLTMSHIAKVVNMAQHMNVSQGEIVRQAIDAFYEQMQTEPTSVQTREPQS